MNRDLSALRDNQFDILVVGGGAFGACAAWEAALRGYSVALVEANDYGSGTSANSYKMVHGGIRYLQHGDLPRLWASCKERSAMLRIAPHLVKPLPIAMPTYGHGMKGKEVLGAGFLAYDALTIGRNRGIRDGTRRIPLTELMGRQEVLERFEYVNPAGLTGAAVFNDAQMYHPPRLVFSFIQSAVERGAVALNYVRCEQFIRKLDKVVGAVVTDRLTGERIEVKSKVVLNAAGPWSEELLAESGHLKIPDGGVYSRDTAFVVDGGGSDSQYAVAIQGSSHDTGSLIDRGARHLFVVPWRGYRLIGVWHIVYRKSASDIHVQEQELDRILGEMNGALHGQRIERDEIRLINAGLVPFGASDEEGQNLAFGKQSHLVDSAEEHGLEGLVTLIGVRHTMARGDSAKALDIIDRKLRRTGSAPDSAEIPIAGGDVASVDRVVSDARKKLGSPADELAPELAALYGSRLEELLGRHTSESDFELLEGAPITRAQVVEAATREGAVTLGDVVFRRTPLGAAGDPGIEALRAIARTMQEMTGWSDSRTQKEIDAVLSRFASKTGCGRISEGHVETLVDDHASGLEP